MNVLEGLEKTMNAILTQAKVDKVVGPIEIKFATPGNKETMKKDFAKIAKEVVEAMGFIYDKTFVIHDDDDDKGFTRIIVTCYDESKIVEYINYLIKRDKVRGNPRQMLNAFNKCIVIADDFNNRFGEGHLNKSQELNEINEIYDLMKSITHKNI